MHLITLIIFEILVRKGNIDEVPKPISNVFMVYRFVHNHNIRIGGHLHTPLHTGVITCSYIGTHIQNPVS